MKDWRAASRCIGFSLAQALRASDFSSAAARPAETAASKPAARIAAIAGGGDAAIVDEGSHGVLGILAVRLEEPAGADEHRR